jgi:simple sugar transport system ATP-binding protein
VLARELGDGPDLVLANNPTRGLDIQAAAYVIDHLRRIRDRGGGVLLISYDLDELLEVADRIVVMAGGRIVRGFVPSEFDAKEIGLAMGGALVEAP